MDIRPARPEDVHHVVPLLYSAGTELYDFIFQTTDSDAQDFIRFEFESGIGFCGFKSVTVMEDEGEVVGAGCVFNGRQSMRMSFGSFKNLFSFYGPLSVWAVLNRLSSGASLIKPPSKGELYLANFGVDVQLRNRGVGSMMMKAWIDKAKAEGYKSFSLDVATNNPAAERLYQRMGLKPVEQKSSPVSVRATGCQMAKRWRCSWSNDPVFGECLRHCY